VRRTRQLRVRTVAPDARVRAATAFPDLGFDAAPPAPQAVIDDGD
jgi:hypothetical protein